VFNQHFSGGNATRPGIFSLFYGLPPTYWTSFLATRRIPVFMQELENNHYQMGIYASAELKLPEFNKTVFAHIPHLQVETPGKNPEERDRTITQEFLRFIANRQPNQPFFSFLFYDSAHSFCTAPSAAKGPFLPAAKVCNRLAITSASNPTPFFNRYKNALTLIDGEIDTVLADLKRQGLLDNTLVVITGDHGEEFNDNQLGFWGHAGNFTRYQTQTPLLILWPHTAHVTYSYTTSHYDITPTLLHALFNCDTPFANYSVGYSLFNPQGRDYLIIGSYIDFGIVEKDRITTIYPSGDYEIDDLHGRPIPGAKLNMPVVLRAFNDLKRFYQ
jgi:membrane-anchored protein YejM (alkaline phosphatase superfamily)